MSRSPVTEPHRRTLILVSCCLGQFLVVLDVSIVNVALPSMRADLGFSPDGLQWVVNAYTLACAGFLLLGGRAAGVLGRREVFIAGLATFGAASLVGGLAQDPAALIVARAAQGLGGAVMAPTSLSILATVFREGGERNRAFGWWGTMGGLGGVSGAMIGGVLTEALSWRAVLLVNVPVSLVLAGGALRVVPPLGRRSDAWRSFDGGGALAATAGLVLLTYGTVATHRDGWGTAALSPIGAGMGLLALFVIIEARVAAAPLVPLRVFRSRWLSGANVVACCLGATAFSMWFFVSLYVQQVLGFSALQAGLVFAPMSLTIVACTQAASRSAARLGPGRVLCVGMTLLGSGMLLFSRVGAGGSWSTDVLVPSLLCAAGIGCSFVSTTISANTGVAAEESGLASGLVNTAFQVGGSIGLAVLATLAAGRSASVATGASQAVTLTEGFRIAFAVGAGLAFAGAAVALVVLARPRQPAVAPQEA